jgi:hypothetical protein
MRNLFAFFGAALLTFVGLGWYLDWYKIKNDPAPAGHHSVNIDINGVKVEEDVYKGVQKAEEKLQHVLDKEKTPPEDKPKPADPKPMPPAKSAPK